MYLRTVLLIAAIFTFTGTAHAVDVDEAAAEGKICQCVPEGSDCKFESRKVIYGRTGMIMEKGEIHIGLKDQDKRTEAFIKDCPKDINRWIEDEITCRRLASKDALDQKELLIMKDLHCRQGLFYCGRKALLDKYKDTKPAHDTLISALKIIYFPEIQYNETMEEMGTRDCERYTLDPENAQ